jgi:hypothetical protein
MEGRRASAGLVGSAFRVLRRLLGTLALDQSGLLLGRGRRGPRPFVSFHERSPFGGVDLDDCFGGGALTLQASLLGDAGLFDEESLPFGGQLPVAADDLSFGPLDLGGIPVLASLLLGLGSILVEAAFGS